MTDADVPQVTKLLAKYVKQFEFRLEFNEDEVRHWLLPTKNVLSSFVVEVSFIFYKRKMEM